MKKFNKGFTLIELLAVIAIIGILGSTVLVSVQGARGKANDVKIISDVKQLKSIIESNYSGIGYPDLTNTSPIYGGLVADSNPGSTTINILIGDANQQGGVINIVNAPGTVVTAYAIYGQLVSTSTVFACIDSVGTTNLQSTTNTDSTCPVAP